MTGESDEMSKDSLEKCLAKREEKLANLDADKKNKKAHDIPTPIMLSGT